MQPAPLQAPLAAYLPDFTRRFRMIVVALAKLVAADLLRNPRLCIHIIPLCAWLNRTVQRMERLMARLAEGRLAVQPRRVAPHPGGPHPVGDARRPTGRGWLVRVLDHESRNRASQLQALLAEPAAVALLAEAPTSGRLIRPLLHLLTLGHNPPVRPAAPPPPPPRPPPPRKPNWRDEHDWSHKRASDEDAPRSSGFPWNVLLGLPEKPA